MNQTERTILINDAKLKGRDLDITGYKSLCETIKYHMEKYYNEDAPEISDFDYDLMMIELKEAENKHPEWITSNSPSQIVSNPKKSGKKVTHDVPMLSIRDVFTTDEVRDFIHEVKAAYPDATFAVEEKIDGLSLTVTYKKDKYDSNIFYLVKAETRGNGFIGEDVTANAKMIKGLPAMIGFVGEAAPDIEELQLRGEVYMSHYDFNMYNEKQIALGKKPAANPRNLAAGTLALDDPMEVANRGLYIFIFNVQKAVGPDARLFTENHTEALKLLHMVNIPVVPSKECEDAGLALLEIENIAARRSSLSYDIDGAVIKINNVSLRNEFSGGSAKYANGHIAYKYPQEAVNVTVDDIEVAVGRTGKLSFTAKVHDTKTGLPANVCGTSVERVTVNNPAYIRDMKIGIGGRYELIKSGEIIPKIVGIIDEPDKIFDIPTTCPCCGILLRHHASSDGSQSVDIFCDNAFCSSKKLNRISYFAGRNQMNIEGLSEQKIDFLIEYGFIDCAADLYLMANQYKSTGMVTNSFEQPLSTFEGWGKTSVDNLMNAIEASRKTNFVSFLAAQGIPGVGHGQAKLLAPAIINWRNNTPEGASVSSQANLFDGLYAMRVNKFDFTSIEGIGPVCAKAIENWIDEELGQPFSDVSSLLKEVEFTDVHTDYVKEFDSNSKIAGKTFVITGTVNHYSNRDELKAEIESLGGKVAGSVSKKTDYLINNDLTSTSGKNAKAKELGIPIISEEEFMNLR